MFERLKRTFSKFVESVVSVVKEETLSEKDVDALTSDLYIDLVESDVAVEVADAVVEELRKRLVGIKVPRFGDKNAVIKKAVFEALMGVIDDVPDVDFYQDSKRLLNETRPVVVMFLGPNGYGKTTTLAKLAFNLQEMGFRVVAAAADTFRAGAREQLEEHGKRVGFKVISGPYGADPASVAYDALQHAKARGYHFVLIDTAGRMHTDANLMEELRKIQRVTEPHYSIFVFDAQLGNEALEIAKYYSKYVKIDGMIATKVDAYPKGGSILTFIYVLKRPVYFLGVGQTYRDLVKFSKQEYIGQLLA
ncbi:signal recognition particle-docking protein FtsY [Pyrobaculum aerophilum]|uniref:Signal recognition particle protein (Docking protein), probable n=2 Tax=Pyrobaculum aerophilum TaxID=13773 RepID=Q8ZTT8_PYRAE|nr:MULTISPECIES: signal recognition particle-docking protein FtsY [Pyrobaculum]AAL64671.1 signal recognition particle protein (docking protein), probable [Pyrobaculum aerophilum str. IM2]MCX8136527.1 signal recognition particle-docking protein FtsY [Pyrobaculum aerophilum]HII46190.1 signal recognition particle-docking protein FtsY [Pyrobaculum aerophilum]